MNFDSTLYCQSTGIDWWLCLAEFYFCAMKHVKLVLGNSSRGIIEAASFGKYMINVGRWQEGSLGSENLEHVDFWAGSIVELIFKMA